MNKTAESFCKHLDAEGYITENKCLHLSGADICKIKNIFKTYLPTIVKIILKDLSIVLKFDHIHRFPNSEETEQALKVLEQTLPPDQYRDMRKQISKRELYPEIVFSYKYRDPHVRNKWTLLNEKQIQNAFLECLRGTNGTGLMGNNPSDNYLMPPKTL